MGTSIILPSGIINPNHGMSMSLETLGLFAGFALPSRAHREQARSYKV
ncbi:hypothetical protein PCL1606_56750 [Pseudomonas chlororaphis]|uniref:Uncharacterized protein n=1 Tax=Pseudomonas chlororaphis TaxID=587753 RepID=A0A0D5Y7X2_9PSED|nr:hypothetical protein PCL1606_56750 [Pseudomonas chlororaphis]